MALSSDLRKYTEVSARLRAQAETLEKQAVLGKFIGGAASSVAKKVGNFAADSVAHPLKKGLPRLGLALGVAGAAQKARAVYGGFNEDAHRGMLNMPPPKTTLASVNSMNLEALIKVSAVANPEAMEKVAECIGLLDRLDPEGVPELMADFQDIADRVNEKTKEANVAADATSTWARKVGPAAKDVGIGALKTLGGTILVGLGLAASTDLLRAAKSKLTEGRNFKRMIDAHPYLKERPVHELRAAFKSVQHFAPDVASDPLASGAIVFRLANASPGDHDRALRDAVAIQKDAPRHMFAQLPKMDLGDRRGPAPTAKDLMADVENEKKLHEAYGVTSDRFADRLASRPRK